MTADNRLVVEPYLKRMVSFLGGAQGAAIVVTSLAVARQHGLDDGPMFVWSAASANDVWYPVARPESRAGTRPRARRPSSPGCSRHRDRRSRVDRSVLLFPVRRSDRRRLPRSHAGRAGTAHGHRRPSLLRRPGQQLHHPRDCLSPRSPAQRCGPDGWARHSRGLVHDEARRRPLRLLPAAERLSHRGYNCRPTGHRRIRPGVGPTRHTTTDDGHSGGVHGRLRPRRRPDCCTGHHLARRRTAGGRGRRPGRARPCCRPLHRRVPGLLPSKRRRPHRGSLLRGSPLHRRRPNTESSKNRTPAIEETNTKNRSGPSLTTPSRRPRIRSSGSGAARSRLCGSTASGPATPSTDRRRRRSSRRWTN